MSTYTKMSAVDYSATGDTVYSGVAKLETDIDQIIADLNSCHTATRGSIAVRGASAMSELAVGIAGSFLRSNGTDPAYSRLLTLQVVTATANLTAGANWVSFSPVSTTVLTLPNSSATAGGQGRLLILESYSSGYKVSVTTTSGTDTFNKGNVSLGTSITMLGPGHTIWLAADGTATWYIVHEFCPPLINVTPVTTPADTNEDDLQTITIWGGALQAGDHIRLGARLTSTGTAGTRTAKLYFGSTALQTEAVNTPTAWSLTGMEKSLYVEAAAVQYSTALSMTENSANTVTVKTTGQTSATADDVISQSLLVHVIR